MCCYNCNPVPVIGVSYVETSASDAVLMLKGVIPACGRFDVRVCGSCLDVCSALPITLKDCAGTSIDVILDRCGNPVLLGKVAVQARRHRVLHFCRSSDGKMIVLQDTICAPTPVLVTTSAAAAPAPKPPSEDNSSDSSCDSGKCPPKDNDIVPPGQYK